MEVEIPRDRTATFVAVRIRPLKTGEDSAGNFCATVEDSDHVRARRDERRGGAYLRSQQSQETRYCFDRAFGPSATQQEVYEATTQEHVAALVNGELPALTVIAYGATGAGKTHTMMGEGSLRKGGAAGNESSAGIIPHSVGELFSGIEALRVGGDARHRSVRVSYLEVYNERVYDLLAPRPENGASKSLKVCEDEKLGIVKVLDLVEEKVSSAVAVLELMRRGNERRATESTGANDVSSRSHAVLQISLAVAGENGAQVLSMIDLAGSERASATGNRGPRLAEGAHINKSLLALANCINALTDATAPKPKFRDSKLTLLLKTALESQTVRLVVVACVSPHMSVVDDTLNTLKYAHRAKELPTRGGTCDTNEPPLTDCSVGDKPAARRRRLSVAAVPERALSRDVAAEKPAKKRLRRASVTPSSSTTTTTAVRAAVAVRASAGQIAVQPPLRDLRRASSVAVANARAAAAAKLADLKVARDRATTQEHRCVGAAPLSPPPFTLTRADDAADDATCAAILLSASSSSLEDCTPLDQASAVDHLEDKGSTEDCARVLSCDDIEKRAALEDVCVVLPVAACTLAAQSPARARGVASSGTASPSAQAETLELERLARKLADADESSRRWKAAACELREHADSLAAAMRACVEAPGDDLGPLRARWEHGLKGDVSSARERWENTIIADNTATVAARHPLSPVHSTNVDTSTVTSPATPFFDATAARDEARR